MHAFFPWASGEINASHKNCRRSICCLGVLVVYGVDEDIPLTASLATVGHISQAPLASVAALLARESIRSRSHHLQPNLRLPECGLHSFDILPVPRGMVTFAEQNSASILTR